MDQTDYYSKDKWATRETRLLDREKKALAFMKPLLIPGAKILDIGCGDGVFMNHLLGINSELKVEGVDISEHQVKAAQEAGLNVKQADLQQRFPYDDNQFDLVYAAEFIEHVFSPDEVLDEIARILKPGGQVVITTPNLAAWYNRILLAVGVQPLFLESSTRSTAVGASLTKSLRRGTTPVGHVRIFTHAAVNDLLLAAGFKLTGRKAAVFDPGFPRPIRDIDRLFTIYPNLGSVHVISAQKL